MPSLVEEKGLIQMKGGDRSTGIEKLLANLHSCGFQRGTCLYQDSK